MPHDRTLDHYGTEDTSTSVLGSAIGRYPTGSNLHTVLEDLVARLTFIESVSGSTRVNYFTSDAIVQKTAESTFTADAVLVGFIGTFTADAFIALRFTADAYIIADPTC